MTEMTKLEHREKLYRLYVEYKCQEMADCRDWVAYTAAGTEYIMEQNNYWLQWGEKWTRSDAEEMWVQKRRAA